MFSRLRSALASLVFLKEEEARYTARFVACLLPIAIALMLLLVILPLMAGDLVQRLEVGGPVLLAWTTSWWLLRQGKVRLASLILVTGTWAVATYAVFTRDGVRAPAYLVYLTLIVYAAFLVTPAAALAVFAAALLVGLGGSGGRARRRSPLLLRRSHPRYALCQLLRLYAHDRSHRASDRGGVPGCLREAAGGRREVPDAVRDAACDSGPPSGPAGRAGQPGLPDDLGSVIGGDITQYFAEEASEQIEERLRAGERGGPEAPDHYFTTLRRADGEELPAEVFSADTTYEGRPATQTVVLDITEQVRMQEALRRSEARLRALFAAMDDIILVLDADGRCLEIAPTRSSGQSRRTTS
jgi:PAS domain-containing protein